MNKIPEGGRNNSMFHFGVYAKQEMASRMEEQTNYCLMQEASTSPLSESEVDIIKRQHDKKEWGYKCNDTPMCNLM